MAFNYDTSSASRTGQITKIATLVFTVFLLVIAATIGGRLFESVDASEIVLIQSLGGDLVWHTQPGIVWQGLGKVTRYSKRGIIRFQPAMAEGLADERLPIVFNDAGKAVVKGSINYELPMDPKRLSEMHSFYPDTASLESGLIKPALNKSIYLTGTMMTSYESYKEKRSMLIQYVEDQTQNGVYRTQTAEREVDEETIGQDGLPRQVKKKVTAVEIVQNNGQPVRNETGQLARFGVRAFNFAIEDLAYDSTVTAQVKQQQEITMAVQTSIAKAKQSIQDAVTAEATGRANIAQARAQQEISKTEAVVQAEKERDVAGLAAAQAAFYKQERILRADADSEYRRRIMAADNALEQRLDAYKYGVDKIANAIATHQGSWVPNVMIGSSANGGLSTVQSLLDMALVNQARQLGLDLTPSGRNTSVPLTPTSSRSGSTPASQLAKR